ncbi:hypothetical protein PR202_gb12860 [Eleusine coracana subsp. coracana]|uniref:Uncharacterized protein n=1 Tax=Eleusine coracana subsp. coracana TaxID=191504 RepID=A0AAV5ER85_ELECO|nr:hypothetical protein PR202_gb12860 [Eleusine coracana subsp. coracana]
MVFLLHILFTALPILVPLYLGAFFGPIYPQKLGTGIHLILEAMISKDYMDIRYSHDIFLLSNRMN